MTIDADALSVYIDAFLKLFPGCENFDTDSYLKEERDYKVELVDCFQKSIMPRLVALPEEQEQTLELYDDLFKLFTMPLDGSENKPQNLVNWRMYEFGSKLDDDSKIEFVSDIAAMLNEEEAIEQRLNDFLAALMGKMMSVDEAPQAANLRSLTTFFLFLSDPSNYIYVTTTGKGNPLQDLTGQKLSDGLDQYDQMANLAEKVKVALEEKGWKPRDLIDVQAFLWEKQSDEESDSEAEAEQSDNEPDSESEAEQSDTETDSEAEAEQSDNESDSESEAGFSSLDLSGLDPDSLEADARPQAAIELLELLLQHDVLSDDKFKEIHHLGETPDTWMAYLQKQNSIPEGNDFKIFRDLYQIALDGQNEVSEPEEEAENPDIQEVSEPEADDEYPDRSEAKAEYTNLILFGPSGTGKTYRTVDRTLELLDPDFLEQHLDDRQALTARYRELKDLGRIGLVTFHQSFSYEDFVEGLRAESDDDNRISYKVESGIFKEMCKSAEGETESEPDEQSTPEPYVLIIDEINRGNIANIFGELITLIDPSNRAGADEALEVTLPYSKEKFSVPANLHIIGTMNTADRSQVYLDAALRRRFRFEEMVPQPELLRQHGVAMIDGIDLVALLTTINARIELLYDREHRLGHSYFLKLAEDPGMFHLADIFEFEILPLLEEYFFEDWGRIQQVLGDNQKDSDALKFIIPAYSSQDVEAYLGSEVETGQFDKAYKRNPDALMNPQAYISSYSTQPDEEAE
jgi:hypothetical protein